MTIPSRPAPPPPNQQQQQQRQQLSQNNGGGYNNTSQTNTSLFKLPPPPTATNKLHNSKCNKSTSSSLSSLDNTSVTSITRKFPSVRTRYGSVNSMNDDPFEIVSKTVENSNVKKKTPPPRPPPPKIDLNQGTNNMALKKLGPPQSISKLSNIFGKKKNNKLPGKQQQSQQFPPNKYPPLSSNNNHTKTNQQQNFQSRPYAFVPPLVRNNYENELISFDSPPSSPTLTTLKKLNSIDSFSFSSDSNFSSSNNGSIKTQSESGFEDDFTSPPSDPWDSFNDTTYSIGYKENDLKISQPVRNLNAINSLKGDDILSNGKSLLPPPPTLTMPTIIKPKTQIPKNNNMIIKKNEAPKPPILYKEEMEKEIDDDEPPMPNCPPPPPPPEEFLNDGDDENSKFIGDDDIVDPLQPPYGIALYEFGGTEDGDLPFKENEKVYILQKLNDNWYFGRNKRGCEGIFPSNYIDIKIPLEDNEINTVTAACSMISNNKQTTIINDQKNNLGKARSLYKFVAEVPEDLSLNENDIVTILHRINDEWLYGEINNRRGQFPANFVEFL